MTTENTNTNKSDVDEAVVEHQSASETIQNSAPPEGIAPDTFKFTEEALIGEHQPTSESTTFTFTEVIPPVEADPARPFTDFIEEFRQAEEARFTSPLRESAAEPPASSFPVEDLSMHEFIPPWEDSSFKNSEVGSKADHAPVLPVSQKELEDIAAETPNKQPPTMTETVAPVVRPPSPLLRPPLRPRLPRHGSGRQREEQPGAENPQAVPAPEAPAVQKEQPRPARRYRFDRPTAPGQLHPDDGKDVTGPVAIPKEVKGGSKQAANVTQSSEQSTLKQLPTLEVLLANGGGGDPQSIGADYDRRHGQDQQRGKEQTALIPPTILAAEIATPPTESSSAQTAEVALEDLPPLEYAELQHASSRRRRRRRSGDTIPTTPLPTTSIPATPTQGQTEAQSLALPRTIAPTPNALPAAEQYNIVSGYTVNQMNQGTEGSGPFMSPDPSPARGSTGVHGNLRAVRAEPQRTSVYPIRTGDAATNQLANITVQAIQAQTDRLVSELRRTSQAPANISVSLPPLASTERVGVFVDVANLLYSARTSRITIDFGKLLDFLRGNRRLVRAQAYCPTSPQSGEDQMFLQAVKGLGYRITTKNYKTFSSGAKKADLDLDLCMDVVRLVDGRAVDCIVLVSGDSDFMPMLDYCSDHGVRVEVAAFDEAMSATLRQSCDLFINLAMLEAIRV